MPSVLSPFGLKAKSHPSGVIRPQRFVVPASDVTGNLASWDTLYQDDAVYIDTNGRVRLTSSPPATGVAQCIGSFSGVEYNDSNGRRTVSNWFNKNAVFNPAGNTGLGTTDVWFWLYTDPELTFEVQIAGAPTVANGAPSGAFTPTAPNFALEGNVLGYSQNVGQNNVTGFGNGFAFVATTPTTASPFIVYNLAYDNQPQNVYTAGSPTAISGNSWSDAYPNVLVRLANAQFNGSVPQF